MMSFTQRLISFALAGASLVAASWTVRPASAWDRGSVQTFAVCPRVRPRSKALPSVMTATCMYRRSIRPPFRASLPSCLYLNDDGKLLRNVTIAGSSPATLGLAFHPVTHAAAGDRLRRRQGAQRRPAHRRLDRLHHHGEPDRLRPQRADLRPGRQRLRLGFLPGHDLEDGPTGRRG